MSREYEVDMGGYTIWTTERPPVQGHIVQVREEVDYGGYGGKRTVPPKEWREDDYDEDMMPDYPGP